MYDNLKKVNKSLYFKYQDIESNIKTFNRAVFVTMQSFSEEYLKYIVKDSNVPLKLENKETLGSLIRNRVLLRILETKYNIYEIDSFTKINELGNSYKHSNSSEIKEEELFLFLEFIGKLINTVILSAGYEIEHTINRIYFKRLTELVEIEKVDTTKQNEELTLLKREMESLQNQQNIMKKNLHKISEKADSIYNLKKKYNEIEEDLIEANRLLDDLEKQRFKLITQIREQDSDSDNNTSNLKKTLDTVVEQLIHIELEIQELDAEKGKIDEELSVDNTNISKNRYETVIDDLQNQMIEMQMQLNDKLNKRLPGKITSEMSFSDKQKAFQEIRYSIPGTMFKSNYIKSQDFSISNLTQLKSSESKYSSFYAVLYNILNRGKLVKPSEFIIKNTSNEYQLKRVYQLQMLLLSLVKENILKDNEWHIYIDNEHVELLNIAVQDIFHWVRLLIELTNKKYTHPSLIISEDNTDVFIEFNTLSKSDKMYIIFDNAGECEDIPVWIDNSITYNIKESKHTHILKELLKYIFGFEIFRDGQIPILANFLRLRNTIGILPTGGGKSLAYYFSVLLQPKVSLIIAPINSLIKDQNDKLKSFFNIDRIANLTSDNKNMYDDLKKFKNGKVLFTFASPERAQSKAFRNILIIQSYNKTIGSVILDEVHCLSEWGHDFRVPYLMLSETLNHYCEGIHYLGLTATASVSVVKDLQIELRIETIKDVIFSKKLKRKNLDFQIETSSDLLDMKEKLRKLLINNYGKKTIYDITPNGKQTNTGIVFAKTIKGKNSGVNSLYSSLNFTFPGIIGKFYGDYKDEQDDFMNDDISLLVATKAFGMGVDKPNVRFTVHFGMPSSREGFYQEAGRAGRDGKSSKCLLYSYENSSVVRKSINRFLNLNTSIQELHMLREELSFKSDISTNFFFLTKDLETPEQETKRAIEIYNDIGVKQRYSKDYILEISKFEKTKNEKYLYLLHKLGIVHNWHVMYSGGRVSLVVEVNSRFDDIEHIKERTNRYMAPYSPNKKVIQFINRIDSIQDLPSLISHVRQWYHDTFIRARREQLRNMYSFIENYKNKSASDEIQNVMDDFFDLTELIGLTEEGFDLTFDDNDFTEIVEYAFDIEDERLYKIQISLERLLESVVNSKVDIFTGLINLRLGVFESDGNGKQRFDYGLNELTETEINEVYNGFVAKFKGLSNQNKLHIINSLSKYIENIVQNLISKFPNDYVLNAINISKINNLTNKIWRKYDGLRY